MVGSHDHISLQLFPKMYYYASPTLRSETTLPLKKKKTPQKNKNKNTPCNRWKVFLSIPYPHITFCLVWQHHDVFQTSATASKRLRIEPKSCILLQLFEATCVRNLLNVKNLEHEKFQEQYNVKKEWLFYLFLTFWKVCHVHFDHMKPCCKLLRQTSKIKKLQTTFWLVSLFQGLPLNN